MKGREAEEDKRQEYPAAYCPAAYCPAVNGRSGGADANRSATVKIRRSSVNGIFAHRALGVCASRPAVHGGTIRGGASYGGGKIPSNPNVHALSIAGIPPLIPELSRVRPSNTLLGAIFDCDGLLADTETPDYDAWREIYEEQGLHFPIEIWAQSIGTAKGQSQNDWHGPLAEAIGPDYNPEAVDTRRRAIYQAAIGKLTPMPGVLALLDALDEAQIPCAVASNSDRAWVDRVLGITGLTPRFRVIATADEVEHPKPAPDVYLLAAKRLGVPPEHCAAFEDSPRGLAAAHAAGLFTVAVPTALTQHFAFAQAHHIVESLERLALKDLRRKE